MTTTTSEVDFVRDADGVMTIQRVPREFADAWEFAEALLLRRPEVREVRFEHDGDSYVMSGPETVPMYRYSVRHLPPATRGAHGAPTEVA